MKDNNVSSENKNMEAQVSTVDNMTTEEFHRLLEENTRKQNELRTERHEKLAAMHKAYDHSIDAVIDHERQATDDFRKSRAAFEEHKQMYDIRMRNLSKARNEIGREYQQGKAQLTNEMAILNEQLQSERHDIFERYRKSGGQIVGDMAGLLHPAWKREMKADAPEQ